MGISVFSSCSSTKLSTSSNNSFKPLDDKAFVFILTPKENIPINTVEVGTFKHIDDNHTDWLFLKNKLSKKAKASGANIIKIEEYHVADGRTGGHAAKILGKFYRNDDMYTVKWFIDSIRKVQSYNSHAFLHLIRNEANGFLQKAGTATIFLNDSLIGDLESRATKQIVIAKLGFNTIGYKPNDRNAYQFNADPGQHYYIQVIDNKPPSTTGGLIGVTFNIGVVPKIFILLDPIEGKIKAEMLEQEKNQL